jgi:hypothetical protein
MSTEPTDYRPADAGETADYLSGYRLIPGAIETGDGLMVPTTTDPLTDDECGVIMSETTTDTLTAAAEAFFYEHAGYSYRPDVETEEEGRRRTARDLAAAERWANDNGYSFQWEWDEWYEDNDGSVGPYVGCVMRDPMGNVVGSLWGIEDEGPDPGPYYRVIEAELASEAMDEAARDEAAALAWGGLA